MENVELIVITMLHVFFVVLVDVSAINYDEIPWRVKKKIMMNDQITMHSIKYNK